MPPPKEKDVIFCSSPIYHELHKLTTYILKFKNQPHSKIKTDFLRAANALVTIQNGGDCDFLVLPQIPMNFQQRQIIGKQGSLLLIMAEDFRLIVFFKRSGTSKAPYMLIYLRFFAKKINKSSIFSAFPTNSKMP